MARRRKSTKTKHNEMTWVLIAVAVLLVAFLASSVGLFTEVSGPLPGQVTYLVPATDDTYIESCGPNNVYGQQQFMIAGTGVQNCQYRTLMKFDLTGIPTDRNIVSAALKFSVRTNGNSLSLTAHSVAQDWNENTANWAALGSSNYGQTLFSFQAAQEETIVTLDATNLASQWLGGNTNYGVVIVTDGPGLARILSAESTSLNVPTLEIVVE